MSDIVVGQTEPFSEEFLDQLDGLDKTSALALVDQYLQRLDVTVKEYYQRALTSERGARHAWAIECNNILRFLRLRDEILAEED